MTWPDSIEVKKFFSPSTVQYKVGFDSSGLDYVLQIRWLRPRSSGATWSLFWSSYRSYYGYCSCFILNILKYDCSVLGTRKSLLRAVRKDEGSQPVGGTRDPPIWVPSSPDLTPNQESPLPLTGSWLLSSLGLERDEWREINIHSFHLLRVSCLVSPKSSSARERWRDKSSRLPENDSQLASWSCWTGSQLRIIPIHQDIFGGWCDIAWDVWDWTARKLKYLKLKTWFAASEHLTLLMKDVMHLFEQHGLAFRFYIFSVEVLSWECWHKVFLIKLYTVIWNQLKVSLIVKGDEKA